MQRLLSSAEIFSIEETFIQCGDLHLVQRLLSSVETVIQYGDFHPVWRLLSSAKTLSCVETLSSAETFAERGYFNPV